jgi:hypothetical protein
MLAREVSSLMEGNTNYEVKTIIPVIISKILPTIGFEFDIDYGSSEIDPPPAFANHDTDGKKITTHDKKTDKFRLKGDGNRIEIATEPFQVNVFGKKEMQSVIIEILKLTKEFEDLSKKAPFHPSTDTTEYKTNTVFGKVVGRPISISPKYLVTNETCEASKEVYSIQSIFAIQGWKTYYRQKTFGVSASPQVTLSIPLAKISDFILHIKKTEGNSKYDFPLSGSSKYRLGLRSDALYKAEISVKRSRKYHISNKTKLSDGTIVTGINYSKELEGLLMLMVSYLITGVLPVDSRDYEVFAKAYLPLNVKNHFRLIFQDLRPEEIQVFKELYFDGSKQLNIFKLADKFKATDNILSIVNAREMFPVKAVNNWGVYPSRPTWFTFVSMIANNTPLIQKKDFAGLPCSVKSAKGDELLFVPISKPIKYISGSRCVILEMRRLGLRMIPSTEWTKLTNKLFDLSIKFNT